MPAATTLADTEIAAARRRILLQARADFFANGYSRLTMDDLAAELGMSKKTLYVHFAGKDEIVAAIVDDLAAEIRQEADTLLRERRLNFAEKLRGFVEALLQRLGSLPPQTVRDLQRFAPKLFEKVEEVRGRTIPYIFSRFVEQGQAAGLIHDRLPPGLAIDFFLHAMQGMMRPATLERLQLAPREVIAHGIDLFFSGLLTPAGRKQYEKLFPR